MGIVLNVVAFQVGWFASVLGAAHGLPWLGPAAVMLVLAWHLLRNPRWLAEITLALVTGAFGFLFDSALVAGGVFSPVRHWMPAPLSPPWMIFLWVNFATLVNVSLKWLQGRTLLAALLGAVGGPAAYYAGAQLGATRDALSAGSILLLSVAWSGAVPAVFYMARVIDQHVKDLSLSGPGESEPK
jgi:hypothetical protein